MIQTAKATAARMTQTPRNLQSLRINSEPIQPKNRPSEIADSARFAGLNFLFMRLLSLNAAEKYRDGC